LKRITAAILTFGLHAAIAQTVANVYVQTSAGVFVYEASKSGSLTALKGSPFSTSGQLEGVTGHYLISVGTDYIHVYSIESNGAVGKQISEINTQDYGGSECGNTTGNGAVLDHTGKYFYVQLNSYNECAAWQTYKLEANGRLEFLNDFEYYSTADGTVISSTVPTTSGNDSFAYGVFPNPDGPNGNTFSAFAISKNGDMQQNQNFTEQDPLVNPAQTGYYYRPELVEADPFGHLAVLVTDSSVDTYNQGQLASYTIDETTGGIKSTNTWKNMPYPFVAYPTSMNMSTSGKFLAVGATATEGAAFLGLQIFNFKGAAPLTPLTGWLLNGTSIDRFKWDQDDHLYALDYTTGALYVFTVTSNGAHEAATSPTSIPYAPYGSLGMAVVSK